MADKTINVRFKQKYDTEANWTSANPVLLAGEMAISSDKNGKYKVGNGTSTWKQLSYAKSNLEKSDVTSALGYTPPTTDECKTFIINITKDTETDTYTADQTFDDAYAAYQAGRNVVIRSGARTFNLYMVATAVMQFVSYQYVNTKAELYAYIKTDGNNKVRYTVYNRYAKETVPGGITAEAKQETDTVPVRIDSETGRAYVKSYDTELDQKADVDHTHNIVSSSSNGFMAISDKQKLDGIESGANKYIHPQYLGFNNTAPGLYKIQYNDSGHIYSTAKVTRSDITALGIPGEIPNMSGATTTNSGVSGIVPYPSKGSLDRFLCVNGQWVKPTVELSDLGITVNAAEINSLSGIIGNVQERLNEKAAITHTHYYAGSSTVGGSANSAEKLSRSAGSTTYPVFFSGGIPVECKYKLEASVPSDAKFTDTIYTHPTGAGYHHVPAANYSLSSDDESMYYLGCIKDANSQPIWRRFPEATVGTFGMVRLTDELGDDPMSVMTQAAVTEEIDSLSYSIENHTHDVMGGASSYLGGKAGFVPAPSAGALDRYLRSDGTWGSYATSSQNGLMKSEYYNKLINVEQDVKNLQSQASTIPSKLEYADFSTFTRNITVTVKNGYGEAGVDIYQSGYAVLGAIGFSASSTYYSIYKIAKTSTMNIDVGIRRVDGATSNESVVVYLTLLAIKTS